MAKRKTLNERLSTVLDQDGIAKKAAKAMKSINPGETVFYTHQGFCQTGVILTNGGASMSVRNTLTENEVTVSLTRILDAFFKWGVPEQVKK